MTLAAPIDSPAASPSGRGQPAQRGLDVARVDRVHQGADSARRHHSEGQEPAAEKSSLLDAFSGWHAPVRELVEATPAEAIIRTCLYERPPLVRLSVGRIALVGDAAHPMLPSIVGHARVRR